MADISVDFWTWSSTAASNSPSGSTAIGTGLDDNLRAIQAAAKGALEQLTSVAGTNTITASMAGLTAYATGMSTRFIPANSNTGATTLNINSLGAKNIYVNGSACVGGELQANVPLVVHYDGTQFNVIGIAPAASDTLAGRIEVAVQSEMESGSSTTLAVTPGRQQFHPSAAKAWVVFNGSSANPITIDAGYNISGTVTKNGTGDYTISFSTSFSSANYCATVTTDQGLLGNAPVTGSVASGGRATGSCRINVRDTSGTATDRAMVAAAFYGDQ